MILAINWGNALLVTLAGFFLVVLILCLLILIIGGFGILMRQKIRIPRVSFGQKTSTETTASKDEFDEVQLTAGQSAAIAMALHLYYDEEAHDEESHIITIKNVERRYSPWNSKIYGINNLVR